MANIKWTYEKCKKELIKYENRNELKKGNKTLYNVIYENKWHELLEGMDSLKLKNGYWQCYDNCRKHTLECETKSEFFKKYSGGYKSILKNKWYELFSHMKVFGNMKKRLVYAYEFSDNSCYVGLTFNIEKRNKQHMNCEKSSVFDYIGKIKLIPKLVLKSDYIDDKDAVFLEREILNDYKEKGWNILNKSKTGSLGSTFIKWDKISCINEIKKYKKLIDFQTKSPGAYYACRRNGWENFFDVLEKRTPRGYFNNKDLCKKEANKYKNRSEFMKNSWSAWNYSKKNGWLDDFFN